MSIATRPHPGAWDQGSVRDDMSAMTPVTRRSRHRGLRARGARLLATCAMGAWVLLAVTPVIVVLCAIG